MTDPTGLWPWDDKCIRGVNCPDGTSSLLESWGDDHPEAAQHIVNFAGGVLDVNPITAFLPLDLEGHGVDPCSGWYRAGHGSTLAVNAAGVAGAVRASGYLSGRELAVGGARLSSGNWTERTASGSAYWAARLPHAHYKTATGLRTSAKWLRPRGTVFRRWF